MALYWCFLVLLMFLLFLVILVFLFHGNGSPAGGCSQCKCFVNWCNPAEKKGALQIHNQVPFLRYAYAWFEHETFNVCL